METVTREGAQSLTLAEEAFLFMVFALGALIKNDSKSEMFYKQASSVAFEVVSETSTESASLAFLIGLYQQTTGRISAAWGTLGVVVRIAQALGCLSLQRLSNCRPSECIALGIICFPSRILPSNMGKYIHPGCLSKCRLRPSTNHPGQ